MSARICPLCCEEMEEQLLLRGRPAAECVNADCELQWTRMSVASVDALNRFTPDELDEARGVAQLMRDLSGGGPTIQEQQDAARRVK